MTPIHIIGHPGTGKTTLLVELIQVLVKRNIRVGTLKHSAHPHELDRPGKDSHKHRMAGASPVAMVNASMAAIYLPKDAGTDPEALLGTYFSNADIVLIEGWISGPYSKMEVWRPIENRKPLFHTIDNVVAVIAEDSLDPADLPGARNRPLRLLKRNNPGEIVDFLLTEICSK